MTLVCYKDILINTDMISALKIKDVTDKNVIGLFAVVNNSEVLINRFEPIVISHGWRSETKKDHIAARMYLIVLSHYMNLRLSKRPSMITLNFNVVTEYFNYNTKFRKAVDENYKGGSLMVNTGDEACFDRLKNCEATYNDIHKIIEYIVGYNEYMVSHWFNSYIASFKDSL